MRDGPSADWVRKCSFRVSKIDTKSFKLLRSDIDVLMNARGIGSYTMCVRLWVYKYMMRACMHVCSSFCVRMSLAVTVLAMHS